MRSEPGAPTLANMSAPPRSTVMLPRLVAGAPIEHDAAGGSARSHHPALDVPVGPGGGRLLSQALCLARVELPTAFCADLRLSYGALMQMGPCGLALALLAVSRHSSETGPARSCAARVELGRIAGMPASELACELSVRLLAIEWPAWVPRIAVAMPLGSDPDCGVDRRRPPDPPRGITCALLAARVVAALRGPVFMRDAAPALGYLLDPIGSTKPSGTWELWLPVRPGTVRPPATAPLMSNHVTNREAP